jgi:hypothetical protein
VNDTHGATAGGRVIVCCARGGERAVVDVARARLEKEYSSLCYKLIQYDPGVLCD